MKLEPNKNIIKAQTLALIQLQLKFYLIWTPCANIVLSIVDQLKLKVCQDKQSLNSKVEGPINPLGLSIDLPWSNFSIYVGWPICYSLFVVICYFMKGLRLVSIVFWYIILWYLEFQTNKCNIFRENWFSLYTHTLMCILNQ